MLWRKAKQGGGKGMSERRRGVVSWLNSEGKMFPEEIEEMGVGILGRFIFGH